MTSATPAKPTKRPSRARRIARAILLSFAALLVLAIAGFLIWANTGVMQAEAGPIAAVRACQYAQQPDVRGLILWGSYCANDLSETPLDVLSVSGSNDGLSTPEKIQQAKPLLPADTRFVEIDGGTHAQFGDYGLQPGDGTATVSDDEVRSIITEEIGALLDPQ